MNNIGNIDLSEKSFEYIRQYFYFLSQCKKRDVASSPRFNNKSYAQILYECLHNNIDGFRSGINHKNFVESLDSIQ